MGEFIVSVVWLLIIYIMVKHYINSHYQRYLRSFNWRMIRQQVLFRDHYQCCDCHSRLNLQVHHLTYAHLYHEQLDDLITLCRRCHRKRHKKTMQ
jgi:5-methylcytosine-specific restriction endonuclease McrA